MKNSMIANELAKALLNIQAIKFNISNFYTWTSGWNSPIYCDNRTTLSFPEIRNQIKTHLSEGIKEHFGMPDVIAGVATAGIPHGALVADFLNLPFVYVRSTPKKHGLENLIEGRLAPHQKVVVIEDLISTGKSSIEAIQAIKNANCEVIGLAAIFTYGFDIAKQQFEKESCPYFTLTNYDTLVNIALQEGYFKEEDVFTLMDWKRNPETWKK